MASLLTQFSDKSIILSVLISLIILLILIINLRNRNNCVLHVYTRSDPNNILSFTLHAIRNKMNNPDFSVFCYLDFITPSSLNLFIITLIIISTSYCPQFCFNNPNY